MTAMTSREMTDAPVPRDEHVPTADQFVMLRGTWETYQSLLDARGERSSPRIAFLDGVVQLMSPSRDHESIKSLLGDLVKAYCVEFDIAYTSAGSWTLRDELVEAGLEPDDCFVFGDHPRRKQRPDLAIEVIWTRGGLEKLEIYRRLGIPEVWFWDHGEISVHALRRSRRRGNQAPDSAYVVVERSIGLPEIDLGLVARLATVEPHTAALQQLRAALR
jgi:Uma2 family endonuclease